MFIPACPKGAQQSNVSFEGNALLISYLPYDILVAECLPFIAIVVFYSNYIKMY